MISGKSGKLRRNQRRLLLSVVLAVVLLCVGCRGENTAGSREQDNNGNAAVVSGSVVAVNTKDEEGKEPGYEVEIKKYGFTLPKLDTFREELENLICWNCAKAPTKEEDNIYFYLKENKALGRNLKVKLSYVKSETSYFDEMDEEGRPSYLVYINFPEIQEDRYIWLCSYNARGICDVYEFDAGDTCSKTELQEEDEYADWGETTIFIDEEKAENYIPEEDTSEVRKKIEKDCLEEIRKYCDGDGEYEIYLYDFLPGEEWIKGRVLDCDPKGGFIPVGWLSVHVCYKGKKMEKYNGIYWHVKPSGTGSDAITPEKAREMLKPYKDEMISEHCFMAYHVKGGQITSLKL